MKATNKFLSVAETTEMLKKRGYNLSYEMHWRLFPAPHCVPEYHYKFSVKDVEEYLALCDLVPMLINEVRND